MLIDVAKTVVKDGKPILRASTNLVRVIDEAKRTIDFIISTERVDRYGDVVTLSGWDLKEYKRNPVVLFGHQNRAPPIGKAIKVTRDGDALRAIAQFMTDDMNPFADSIFKMYQQKFLKATSVGFMPINYEPITDDKGNFQGYKFTKQELLEFSCVPIPANPDALVDAKAKGIDVRGVAGWMGDTLDNWSELGGVMKNVYGVDKEELEAMRRKVVPAGQPGFKIDPKVQDELLARNLAASKAQHDKGGDDSIPETFEFEMGEGDAKRTFDLPIVEPPATVKAPVIGLATDDAGVESVLLEEAPEKVIFSVDFLKSVGQPWVKPNGTKDGILLDATDQAASYRFVGATVHGFILAERVSLTVKQAPIVIPKVEEKAADPAPAKVEPTVKETEKVPEPAAKKEEAAPALKSVEDKKKDNATLADHMASLEKSMLEFETALDDNGELRSSADRHTTRKLKFLGDCLRELADRLSPVKDAPATEAPTKGKEVTVTKDAPEGMVSISEAETLIVARLGPAIAGIVTKEVTKLRGKLD